MESQNKDILIKLDKTVAIGTQKIESGDYPQHYHDHFEMELVLSGHGKQILKDNSFDLDTGDIYLMKPLDSHKIHSDNLELLTINVKPEILPKWMLLRIHSSKIQKVYHLNEEDFNQITTLIGFLRNEVKKVNTIYNLTSNIVEMIFSIFLRNAKNDFSEEENLESKIIYYLQKNNRFTNKVSLDDIAKYVGYSKYYTSTTFHKNYGITIQDFLINLRVEYAKKLLLETDFSINDIIKQCGFCSVSNFYNNFIKLTGQTPLKFKKEYR